MTVVQRYGILRVDSAGTWSILNDGVHKPYGLTGTPYHDANGCLVVPMWPVLSIGVFGGWVDETYAGRIVIGVSMGTDRFVVTFRDALTGETLDCNALALRLPHSNIQLTMTGEV